MFEYAKRLADYVQGIWPHRDEQQCMDCACSMQAVTAPATPPSRTPHARLRSSQRAAASPNPANFVAPIVQGTGCPENCIRDLIRTS